MHQLHLVYSRNLLKNKVIHLYKQNKKNRSWNDIIEVVFAAFILSYPCKLPTIVVVV